MPLDDNLMVSDMETEASLTTVSLKDVGGITKKNNSLIMKIQAELTK